MIMTAVIDPDAFAPACFTQTGYQDQVALLFRGIDSNGAMLLDSDGRLLRELENKVSELPIKYRQDLEIRFAEYRKKPNRGRLWRLQSMLTIMAAESGLPCRSRNGLIVCPILPTAWVKRNLRW